MHIIYFLLYASLSIFTSVTSHSHTITSIELPNNNIHTRSSTHMLHISNDASMKLCTLSKPFHCIWETSLGDNLTRTVIYNKNIIYENKALIPMEGKLYIYNNNSNEQFQEFTISIPKLLSRVPFSLGFMRGYYFTGSTTRKVSHVDMRNGYMHLFVNNNINTLNHFVTVYRTDYTLVCVHKESNVDMWKATVSEIELVTYGNVVQYVISSNSNMNGNNNVNDDDGVNSVFYYNNSTNVVVKVGDDVKRDDTVNESNDVIQENICEGCYYVRREDTPVLKLNVVVDINKRSNSSCGKVKAVLTTIVKVVYYYDYSYLFDIALGVVVGVVIILTGKCRKVQRGRGVIRKEDGTKSIIKEFYLGRREIGVTGGIGKRKRILSDANNAACGNCNCNYKGKRFGSGIECNGVRGVKTKSLCLMRNGNRNKLEEENEDDDEKERVFVKEQEQGQEQGQQGEEKENEVDDINEIKEYEENENIIKPGINEDKNEDNNINNNNDDNTINNNNDDSNNVSNEHEDDDNDNEQCGENNVYYNLWDSDDDNNELDNNNNSIEQSHNNNNNNNNDNPSIIQDHTTQIETISSLTTTTITPNNTTCKTRLEKDFSEFTKIAQSGCEYTLKARHRIDEKIYAIKIILLESQSQQDLVKEIKIMKQLLEKHQVHYKTCWLDKSLGGLTKLILEDEVISPPEEKLPKSKSYSKLTKRLSHNSLLNYLSIDKQPISTFTSYIENDDHFIEDSNVFGYDDNDDENDSDDEFKDKETKVKECNRKNSEDISKCEEMKTPFKRRKRDTQSSSQIKSGIEYGYGSDNNTESKNSKDDNQITTFTKKNSFNYFFIQMEYFDEDEEEEENENDDIISEHDEDIKCN